MDCSRRELGIVLSALFAAERFAQSGQEAVLPSKCYPFDSLTAKENPNTHNVSRNVFSGLTHSGYHVDLHITTLQPGLMPHPPHSHVHEEIFLVKEGTLDAMILEQTTRVGPGSVVYIHSNERHSVKNVGDTPAQYFVLALGKDNV